MNSRETCNTFRDDGSARGHYESFFLRANHPERPLAFWIRYTFFCPRGARERALGELWAIYFDGETNRITAAKEALSVEQCSFSRQALGVRIGEASLDAEQLRGAARSRSASITWDLTYRAEAPPLLLLSPRLYEASFPKAKALVPAPLARFAGTLEVQGEQVEVADWVGSQNHNWGERHTDRYAWGQVAGFDNAPHAFLECATARVRLGPVWTPAMSPVVLRLESEELRFNRLLESVRTRAHYEPFRWRLSAENRGARIDIELEAAPTRFVALPYDNPPGGQKICLNSKLARCTVRLSRPGKPDLRFHTEHRAAFEILQDETVPGVPMAM